MLTLVVIPIQNVKSLIWLVLFLFGIASNSSTDNTSFLSKLAKTITHKAKMPYVTHCPPAFSCICVLYYGKETQSPGPSACFPETASLVPAECQSSQEVARLR